MKTYKYKVTVGICAYNHEKYIQQCIDSIAAQTYKDFQWVIIDDGSKDRTLEILQANQKRYGYKLIHQENKGVSATLTRMLTEFAEGEYYCGCASDDYWVPEKLAIQLKFMEEHPEYAYCYGNSYDVDTDSKLICLNNNPLFRSGYLFEDIITQKFHPPVNRMYRYSVLGEMGFYKSGVIAEDFYMDCKISHKYFIGYINEFLSYYRVRPLASKRDPFILYKSHEFTIKMYKGEKIYKEAISKHYYRMFKGISTFKKHKIQAIKYAFLSIDNILMKDYWINIYYIFFRHE